jgi:para-nitrobenzyl esterase
MQLGPVLGPMALAQYPSDAYGSPRLAYVALTSDARFICPSRRFVRAAAAAQDEPVWRYFFIHTLSGPAQAYGAFHGLELGFVFGTLGTSGQYVPTAEDDALAGEMGWAWIHFAEAGDPNGAGAPTWPQSQVGTDLHVVFDAPSTTGDGVRTAECDFWDSLALP